ncbi:MAG: hypothetical protein A2790_20040 [Phenylobacterium sp. RIFCSPHIGHO2_01_FULL_69_31]|uniref:hypothetical protein n=1 Tax=Phenylobacterium sp. RIFCSPHIGHO2_01_FULL_69_31 TaxID=1801944 RepID=UPI0008ACCD0C|nr:hypothetical protein [Phenylobacterium sp. RIFCSPHIGHO2_01_FULL_69_31]OHB26259.1 MAG: hypothetical protein A2790_20040 [Phenylobacterium sp. RIFCSPHIGHO2_01_FULL_69_31]
MKFTFAVALGALLVLASGGSPAQAQSCPVGSYPWTDSWGNKICKRHGDGGTASVETRSGQACPVGSHPWVDNWGNKVCREQGSGSKPTTDYYDISKGCPTGTHPWTDEWGNKVCKKF